jgi:hypothetical protein
MRFFYYYPTNDRPAGGNKQLRLQATLLRELGVESFLLREEQFFTRPNSFDDNALYSIPVETASFPFERAGEHLKPDDVLVLPEVVLNTSLARCDSWKCRIAVNNQNGFYGIRYGPPRRWCGRRIEFAIANAGFVADLCHRFYNLPRSRVFLVPYWMDRPPFAPPAPTDPPADLAVGFMPRKLPEVNALVREVVSRTHPDVPWVEIDGLPETEVAAKLRRLAVFFAAQDIEGFGMPAIEAMACGCVVAGFPGTGRFPHPYATPRNGLWAPDRDSRAAASAVSRAIELVKANGAELTAYRAAVRNTLSQFTRETALAALSELAKVVANRSYASRIDYKPAVLGWRHEPAVLRLLYNSNRLGWPGRVVDRVARLTKPLRRAFSGGSKS